MNIADIQLIYDYNYWANHLILTTAAQLTEEQFTQPTSFPWGNLRRTLIHTMDAENMWRNLCQRQTIPNPRIIDAEPFPTFESIVTYWQGEEAEMRAYLHSLHDSDMENVMRYQREGLWRNRVLWQCLVHLVNHGTQHRSECAAMLTDFGHSPGGIDMTLFLNQLEK